MYAPKRPSPVFVGEDLEASANLLLSVRAGDKCEVARDAYPVAMRVIGRAIGTSIVRVLINPERFTLGAWGN